MPPGLTNATASEVTTEGGIEMRLLLLLLLLLPEFIMNSYYYQRCCNLLQMHRPTQTGRCWSQELCQKNYLNGTEITPEGRVPNNSLIY